MTRFDAFLQTKTRQNASYDVQKPRFVDKPPLLIRVVVFFCYMNKYSEMVISVTIRKIQEKPIAFMSWRLQNNNYILALYNYNYVEYFVLLIHDDFYKLSILPIV